MHSALSHTRVAALVTAGFAVALPAAADTFGGQIHYVVGNGAFDGVELTTPAALEGPALLTQAKPRLRGMGTFQGVSVRGDLLVDSWRLGVGSTWYGVDGVGLRTDALPWGLSAELSSLWATSSELFVGYEIKQGPVYPYIDGRLSLSVLQAQIDTHAAPHGHVGTNAFTGFSFGVGPRFGALVPIGHSLTLDVYAYRQIIGGFEQLTVGIGVGFWENDRDDAFSNEMRRGWRGQI